MNYVSKQYIFPSILILLFPVSLISGPLIPELLMLVLTVFFLITVIKNKEIKLFNNKFFIYISIYTIYIVIISYFSVYKDEILLKNLFYFRFILFVFAVYYFFLKSEITIKLLYYVLIILFSILIIDGYLEFFSGKNLLGNTPYREDRISSFFKDRLVLGSFVSKYFFLTLGLFFLFNKEQKKSNSILFSIIIFFSFLLIFFSGERSAFISTALGIIIFLICANLPASKKIFLFLIFTISITIFTFNNKIVYERQIEQTFNQVNFNATNKHENFFQRFAYYDLTYKTAFNGFLNKRIFGQGPKSFRFFCSKKNIEVLNDKPEIINNEILFFGIDKKFKDVEIVNINVSIGDKIFKDDLILTFREKKILYHFKSNKEGVISQINIKDEEIINSNHTLLKLNLDGTDIPLTEKIFRNGCTTHPHNFYLQLLSETGLIGTFFILYIFLYLIFILSKFFYKKSFKGIIELNNTQLCLVINFFILLLPILPNGNFFNNWMNMTFLIQISFYLFIFNKNKKKSYQFK